jgi:dihydroorotate dehydrogenase
VLVKLDPDLPLARTVTLAAAAVEAGAAGVVATNTTVDHSLVAGVRGPGGLSGRVLRDRSFRVLQALAAELFGRALLVSVGGVDSADEAYRRLRAGAHLVELYTALVFGGPGLVGAIDRGLSALLERDGAASLGDVVGADLRG